MLYRCCCLHYKLVKSYLSTDMLRVQNAHRSCAILLYPLERETAYDLGRLDGIARPN